VFGLIDSFSRFAVTYLLNSKDEVDHALQKYIADNGCPRILVTDNAREFRFGKFSDLCLERGIRQEFTAAYTPEENGKIERLWSSLNGMARCLLRTANLNERFWSFAFLTANHIKNRCWHSAIKMTPYEKFFGLKPDISHMRIFGCTAYAFIEKEKRRKLDSRSQKGILLGYSTNSKTFVIGVKVNRRLKLIETRNVKFREKEFEGFQSLEGATDSDVDDDETFETPQDGNRLNLLDRPQRNVTGPSRYGYDENFNSLDEMTYAHECFESEILLEDRLPKCEKSALEDQNWYNAMKDEHRSLLENEVWKLEKLPRGKNIVGSRWHFAIKKNSLGEITRYKARFVAKGYKQQKGQDFQETYCPTMKLTTLRVLLAFAAHHGLKLKQLDVKTAYLNAPIEEEVYIEQPKGFEVRDENGELLACKLQKSLYGLKQAGRNWYNCLKSHLTDEGFKPSSVDPCLFVRVVNGVRQFVVTWVDDIVYCSRDENFLAEFEMLMKRKFKISECSNLNWFLGMNIVSPADMSYIAVNQEKYIEKLLEKFGMTDCKPLSTPCAEKSTFSKNDCPADGSEEQFSMVNKNYRGLIGAINYLANTSRPDLAYIAHCLSRFVSNPGEKHWIAAKRVLRYLKYTKASKLVYNRGGPVKLIGFSDSDFAGDVESRKSLGAYCYKVSENSGVISWKSKQQGVVATSTAQAESLAVFEACTEAEFLSVLVPEFFDSITLPIPLNIDNQACIALCKSNINSQKVKHFAIKLRYLQDLYDRKLFVPIYCPTDEMIADSLTKPLGKVKVAKFNLLLLGSQP